MSCCICMGSNNLMKVKCCNQQYHVDCVNHWLKQKKFTCPMCRNVKHFMGSLPCMREAIHIGLRKLFFANYQFSRQRSDIFCGYIDINSNLGMGKNRRILRSNTRDGFFFDYKGSKIWIKVIYIPQTRDDPTYELTLTD